MSITGARGDAPAHLLEQAKVLRIRQAVVEQGDIDGRGHAADRVECLVRAGRFDDGVSAATQHFSE